jgi:hypothetical protein
MVEGTSRPPLDILRISMDNNGLAVDVGWLVIGFIIFVTAIAWAFHAIKAGKLSRKKYELTELSFGTDLNKMIIRPSYGDRELAYKIWVELSTRKIGLEIDPEHDVISEIYDSWYKFFQVTRDMIKLVPVSQVRDSESQKIVNLSIDVLNEGLRPHLTRWQARFRRWYGQRIDHEDNYDFHPQDVQKQFPEYDALITDLLALNVKLAAYRAKLREIVFE